MAKEKDILVCPCCNSYDFKQLKNGVYRCAACGHEILSSTLESDIRRQLNEIVDLRQHLEFEDACARLDDFISENRDCADAYFQKILASYGVQYVKDYDGITMIPTISRASTKSILTTGDYKLMLQFASSKQEKDEFITRVDEIEKLREEIINKSRNEEPFDIFICYKRTVDDNSYTKDSQIARKVYDYLNRAGYKVFFAEESLNAGEYEPIIYNALMTSSIMLVVAASKADYLISPWVKNEWQRFAKIVEDDDTKKKMIIPITANGFDPYDLPGGLQKYQAINYDAEFNDKLGKELARRLSVNLKSRLNKTQVSVNDVKPIQVQEVKVTKRTFGGTQTTIVLASSDRTKLEDARNNLKRKRFPSAEGYAKAVLKNNANHAEAAWICFLIGHKVANENELANYTRPFRFSAKYSETLEYARIALENDSDNYQSRLDTIEKFIQRQAEIGVVNELLYNFFIEYIPEDYELDFVQDLNRIMLNYLRTNKSLSIKFIDYFQKLIYPILTKSGAEGLILHYNNLAKTLLSLGRFSDAEKYYNETLKLFEYNPDALWGVYRCKKKLVSDSPNAVCKVINNPKEIADIVTKMIQGGYRIRLSRSNYVYACMMYAYDLVKLNKTKKGVELFDEIYKVIPESHSMRDDLIRFADYLLLHGQFKAADKYYEAVQATYDKYDFEAHLGRFKVSLKVRTNYGLLAIKRPFDSFKTAYDTMREVEAINADKGQEKLFTKLLDMHSDVLDCPSRKDRNDKFTQFIYLEKEDILNDYPTKIPDLRVKSDILREFKARKARKRREKANFVSNAEKTKMHNAWIITQFALIAFHFLTMWSFGSEVPLLLVGTAGICLLGGIVIGFKQAGLGGAIGGYFGGGILGAIAGGILFGVSGLIYTLLFNLFDIDTFLTVVPMTGFLVYAFGFVFHIIRGIVKKQRITFGFIFWNLVMIGACVYVSSLLSNLIFEKLPYIAMGFEGFFM